MYSWEQLQELTKMANAAQANLNQQITIFEQTLQNTLRDCSEEHKATIAELITVTNKALNLAKMGKAAEAQELLNTYRNGRKSNEPEV